VCQQLIFDYFWLEAFSSSLLFVLARLPPPNLSVDIWVSYIYVSLLFPNLSVDIWVSYIYCP